MATTDVRTTAEREANSVMQGPKVSLFGAELPKRALIALAVFVAAFTLVWVALWAALGGIGLALGWIPAAALGWLAVRLVLRSARA